MGTTAAAPRWLMLLVVAAVIAGIALALWLYGALTVAG